MNLFKSAFLALLMTVSLSGAARAEAFATPNLESIVKVLVRYGALNIRYDEVMDLYGGIMVCDIFQELYKDDFKWNDVRKVLRKKIKDDVAFYPTGFKYDAVLQLGKYDFKEQVYRFNRQSEQINTNTFTLKVDTNNDNCRRRDGLMLPSQFKIILREPLTIIGLPMNESDGKKLLYRMEKQGNEDHIIYARFNIRVTYIAPIFDREVFVGSEIKKDYRSRSETAIKGRGRVQFDSLLDSVEYYEDRARTRLIYRYEP